MPSQLVPPASEVVDRRTALLGALALAGGVLGTPLAGGADGAPFAGGADAAPRAGGVLGAEPDDRACAAGAPAARACPGGEDPVRTGTGAAGLTSGVLVLVAGASWALRRVRENRWIAGPRRRDPRREGQPPSAPFEAPDPTDPHGG